MNVSSVRGSHTILAGIAVLAFCGLALTGCGGSPAAPASAPVVSTTTVTETAAAAPVSDGRATTGTPAKAPKPDPSTKFLGPDGYGKLKLGMTRQQALATGEVKVNGPDYAPGQRCIQLELVDDRTPAGQTSVVVSAKFGVVSISAGRAVRTPKGIGVGSTLAEVKAAYPTLKESANGHFAEVPEKAEAVYFIGIPNDSVTSISLEDTKQDCLR